MGVAQSRDHTRMIGMVVVSNLGKFRDRILDYMTNRAGLVLMRASPYKVHGDDHKMEVFAVFLRARAIFCTQIFTEGT